MRKWALRPNVVILNVEGMFDESTLAPACRYSARAAAASALQDEVQAWAQLLGSRLQLSDARSSEALRAAEAWVLEHSRALEQHTEQPASAPMHQNSIQVAPEAVLSTACVRLWH